ncbi:hypothetical protein POM88_043801 [Heracleum sosnowskyi]|uniref:Protein SirB1 N-terminal domain-containing protein n=1 Tax=Heracleum sosnowskyi TaxID=360622 RepID=A0AAD8M4L6_9APIA|nr:hypothetical protein POM88_043801 [Heracleum sosnowskyi]
MARITELQAELKAVVNASNINSPMSCKASCRGDKEEQEEQEEQEEHDEDDGCVAIGPVDPSPPEKKDPQKYELAVDFIDNKDIFEDKDMKFIAKWAAKTRKSYKREELDDVRFETLGHIQGFVPILSDSCKIGDSASTKPGLEVFSYYVLYLCNMLHFVCLTMLNLIFDVDLYSFPRPYFMLLLKMRHLWPIIGKWMLVLSKMKDEVLQELDAIAKEVQAELVSRDIGCHLVEVLEAVNIVLFESRGFQRSPVMVDSKCSYMHSVLSSGRGSVIILSIIYIEVCRRLNLNIVGSQVGEDFLIWPETGNPEELFKISSGRSLFGVVNGRCVEDPRSKASDLNNDTLLGLDIVTNRDIIGIALRVYNANDKFNQSESSDVPLLRPRDLRFKMLILQDWLEKAHVDEVQGIVEFIQEAKRVKIRWW